MLADQVSAGTIPPLEERAPKNPWVYPPNDGTPELLAAIGGWLERRYGVRLDHERRVMALNGTREGLFNAALAQEYEGNLQQALSLYQQVLDTETCGNEARIVEIPPRDIERAGLSFHLTPVGLHDEINPFEPGRLRQLCVLALPRLPHADGVKVMAHHPLQRTAVDHRRRHADVGGAGVAHVVSVDLDLQVVDQLGLRSHQVRRQCAGRSLWQCAVS